MINYESPNPYPRILDILDKTFTRYEESDNGIKIVSADTNTCVSLYPGGVIRFDSYVYGNEFHSQHNSRDISKIQVSRYIEKEDIFFGKGKFRYGANNKLNKVVIEGIGFSLLLKVMNTKYSEEKNGIQED